MAALATPWLHPTRSPSSPLACCSALSHSTSHRKPPLCSSGLRSAADLGSTTKGIVFARTEYIPQVSADGGWGFEVIQALKNACLQSMGEPHLCSGVADYVLQLPERGNVGKKSVQMIALNSSEEKEPYGVAGERKARARGREEDDQ